MQPSRQLNQKTRKDAFPLPRIEETLDALSGDQWFSTIDLILLLYGRGIVVSLPLIMLLLRNTCNNCLQVRQLNQKTRKDAFPLPRIEETLDALSGDQWFSTIDLNDTIYIP
ncbi:Retrovirus-related Pol poly from transposon [Labeo rohita]|uniref:Retrovirus-related Pol poly from transposon n=1 Tax=Labeo rohita TaxID=84645 RepID=A0A498P7V0_LABRO|nr:Retrovirus-related Pol poly from transposon [Labeo rohita]